ncbi:MAG: radical SAM superfamily enzyme YgiQ (UPF0313 family) [Rhodothermales bacterium]|jgi:radical SAM superfamily enzyme YgiQ (UPF0313 family)
MHKAETRPPLRIALISPKGPLYRHRTGIFGKSLRMAPLTLTTLAALLPEEIPVDLQLLDEGIEDVSLDLEADLIGMTVITGTASRSYELAAHFRAQGIAVVLGGPHVTLVPEEAAQHADAIVVGYAEETWPQLVRDAWADKMQPRYEVGPDFSFEKPANQAIARRDLLNARSYITTATFEATRGCAHVCNFCVVPAAWPKGPYQKPIAHVVDDIRRNGAKRIVFYDLNLIAHLEYAKELFRALIPLKVRWFGLATVLVDRDPELMELLAQSGCAGLLIGFESISPSGLSAVNKRFNQPDRYAGLIRALHDHGIAINGTFMFGSDDDAPGCFEATVDFIREHRIDLPRFSILTPFPATSLYRQLDAQGRILTSDWELYDGQHVVFQPAKMSVDELVRGHEWAWKEVYSASGIARRMMPRISGLGVNFPVVMAANLGYRHYAYNLSRFYTCMGGLA